MPSFVLGDYSVYPTKFVIYKEEMLYYSVSGLLTFVFHSQFTQIMSQPANLLPFPSILLHALIVPYIAGLAFDSSSHDMENNGLPLVGAAIIVVTGIGYDCYRVSKHKHNELESFG